MKRTFTLFLITLLGITGFTSQLFAAEVNIYSARKEALIKPLLDRFTSETGIQVNLVTGKADALIKRLEAEGRNSPADLLLTTDAGRLYRAKTADLLQPVTSPVIEQQVPSQYLDPEHYWVGLSVRSRVIMYSNDRVKPEQLSTYEALAEPAWKKRICIRSSNNIYNQSLTASMIIADGEDNTAAWANGLVANLARPPRGGDRDQVKAVAAGQCDLAVANTYYLAAMLNSDDPAQQAAAKKVSVFWPNQNDRGAHVNISGAGVTAHAKNKDNAIKLMEFLVSESAQAWYAEVNHEYPVTPGVAISDTLLQWGKFKSDVINLSGLGEHNAAAVRIMDRAGWR